MAKPFLTALLTLSAAAAQAQPPSADGGLQPSPDSAADRQAFRSLSVCLAKSNPGWARRTLARPYLSKDQASDAAKALVGEDRCAGPGEVAFTFRTSGLVGGLAEAYVRPELERGDLTRVATALAKAPPLNASEDFALCLAARNPVAAKDLVVSDIGSDAETMAARRIAANVPACTQPGEKLKVDLQALRALIAVAMYRSIAPNGAS